MLKAGDIIKIENKDHQKIADELIETCDVAHAAFITASAMVKNANDKLWDFLYETNPETVGWKAIYSREDYTIRIMGKLSEGKNND